MFNQSRWFYLIEFITVEVQLTLLFDNIHAFWVVGCFPLYASEKFEQKKNVLCCMGVAHSYGDSFSQQVASDGSACPFRGPCFIKQC